MNVIEFGFWNLDFGFVNLGLWIHDFGFEKGRKSEIQNSKSKMVQFKIQNTNSKI